MAAVGPRGCQDAASRGWWLCLVLCEMYEEKNDGAIYMRARYPFMQFQNTAPHSLHYQLIRWGLISAPLMRSLPPRQLQG